jgi:hypothetical protein
MLSSVLLKWAHTTVLTYNGDEEADAFEVFFLSRDHGNPKMQCNAIESPNE